jgi:ribosome-binding protein aMBF1 (putative translation factor)
MNDQDMYLKVRKIMINDFSDEIVEEYEGTKIGVVLREARKDAGFTQEEIAKKLNTKKSAISRIENYSGDIRLSTLLAYVQALGKKLQVEIS